jgi:multisubunit Na+/H+ antiporter MnhE subunit
VSLWGALAVLWLWLDDTVAVPELVTGAVCAAIAATVAQFVLEQAAPKLRLRARWLRLAWRPLVSVVPDLARLARVLVWCLIRRPPARARFRAIQFEAGSSRSPYDTGRRALAKGAGSFSPNTFVVGIDADRDLILVHQLEPVDTIHSADPLELG